MVSGVIAAIAILYEPYEGNYKADSRIDLNYDLIVNLILVLLQLVKFILLCCCR